MKWFKVTSTGMGTTSTHYISGTSRMEVEDLVTHDDNGFGCPDIVIEELTETELQDLMYDVVKTNR